MTEDYKIEGKTFVFETRPGVFSQYGLDRGSKLLLEVVELPNSGQILDLGCGCGFMGIVVAGLVPKTEVMLVDSDIRAVKLSRENGERNGMKNVEVVLNDTISGLPEEIKFDLVISNPPTHQGREVVVEFIRAAHQVLKPGGKAYFVVNRMASVMDRLKEEFGNSEKIIRRNGYIVFRASKQ